MKFRKFLIETKDVGKTSKDEGHRHEFAVDRFSGNGATSKDSGHNHKIRKFIVLPAGKNDHIHRMLGLKESSKSEVLYPKMAKKTPKPVKKTGDAYMDFFNAISTGGGYSIGTEYILGPFATVVGMQRYIEVRKFNKNKTQYTPTRLYPNGKVVKGETVGTWKLGKLKEMENNMKVRDYLELNESVVDAEEGIMDVLERPMTKDQVFKLIKKEFGLKRYEFNQAWKALIKDGDIEQVGDKTWQRT